MLNNFKSTDLIKIFSIVLLLMGNLACQEELSNNEPAPTLRPTKENLRHDIDKKFIGHEGIKELCEKYLGMRYLYKPEIKVEEIKNKSESDLKDPAEYKKYEIAYGKQVQDSYLADVYAKFISDEIGYGVFANADIAKDSLISEYAGVIELSSNVKDSTWAWHYPNEKYKEDLNIPKASLDAKYAGNGARFVNHSDNPNVEMRYAFVDGYFRVLYVTTRDIKKDQQILVSYGSNYWKSRDKEDL